MGVGVGAWQRLDNQAIYISTQNVKPQMALNSRSSCLILFCLLACVAMDRTENHAPPTPSPTS